MEIKDLRNLEEGIFLVTVLAIVYDPHEKKILIGRRENDPHVPTLSWGFPGGKVMHDKEIWESLKESVKKKTGFEIADLGTIFSRIPDENKGILLIYHLCEKIKGKEKPGDGFKELKWVKPEEIKDYFETSIHPHMEEYINNLK